MVNLLIDGLRHQFQQVPDPRSGGNTQFSFDDIGMAAFSVFFVQSPSFPDHHRKFHEAHNRDACQSLFGMRRIPTDNHIRKQLDGIACQSVYPAFDMAIEQLTQHQGLKPFLRFDGRILIALDGSQFHISENIHCSQCSTRKRKDGNTEYSHSVLQHNRVIALRPEFITPQDGAAIQDCEINAAKRWLHNNLTRYQHLRPVYLGDDLYSRQPLCQTLIERGADFLLVAKPASHTTMYDYLNGLNLPSKTVTQRRPGNKTETRHYRWASHIPLNDSSNPLQVNWLSIEIV